MQYAINIADTLQDQFIGVLIGPVVAGQKQVECELNQMDGIGLLLECDQARAEAIIAMLRRRYKMHQVRIYQSKTGNGGWKRI